MTSASYAAAEELRALNARRAETRRKLLDAAQTLGAQAADDTVTLSQQPQQSGAPSQTPSSADAGYLPRILFLG
ncbi:MAG TPA: hypothetical protein VG893_13545 [Terracidiphilus sp.]|nr:hypothetical protein [Terracidiphilus sp.]